MRALLPSILSFLIFSVIHIGHPVVVVDVSDPQASGGSSIAAIAMVACRAVRSLPLAILGMTVGRR